MTHSYLKTIQTILALLFMGGVSTFAQTISDPFPEVPYSNWQGNMTMTCKVTLNGQMLNDKVIVAAYHNNEIRGKVGSDEENMIYLTVGGNAEKVPLHFKVYTGGRIIEVDQGIQFTWQGAIGNYDNPYLINLTVITTNTSDEGWATTCLPYNAAVPEGVTVYSASRIEGGVLKIEPVACTILPKETPVLLKTEGQKSYEWLSRVADGDAEITTNLFKGTTEAMPVEVGSVLTLGHATDGAHKIGFWLFSGTSVPANRAYLEKGSTLTRGVVIDWNEASGISDNKREIINNKRFVYDLQGRRVKESGIRNSESRKGSLMIVNGKKVVMR